jgi:hypothetical protein
VHVCVCGTWDGITCFLGGRDCACQYLFRALVWNSLLEHALRAIAEQCSVGNVKACQTTIHCLPSGRGRKDYSTVARHSVERLIMKKGVQLARRCGDEGVRNCFASRTSTRLTMDGKQMAKQQCRAIYAPSWAQRCRACAPWPYNSSSRGEP